MIKKIVIFIFSIFAVILFSGCTKITTSKKTINSTISSKQKDQITPNTNEVNIYVGDSFKLTWTANFTKLESERVSYVSSDANIASVSVTGLIKGIKAGETFITMTLRNANAVIKVKVSENVKITAPTKTNYYQGEELNLLGGKIEIFNGKNELVEEVLLLKSMISGYDPEGIGEQILTITYHDITYKYSIIVNQFDSNGLKFADAYNINEAYTNEKVSFRLEPKDFDQMVAKVKNVYDYTEMSIYATFKAPSGKTKTVNAYWNQDYSEVKTKTVISTNEKLEGYTNPNAVGYDFKLTLNKDGNPYYRINFTPNEVGEYEYTVYVTYCGILVQEFTRYFDVYNNEKVKDYSGVISVSDNNFTFVDEKGKTYMPVGENMAWYTSKQRRYYDYEMWLNNLDKTDSNFIRVWLSAWGFALFWDDVDNYDSRLDEAYELDQVFDMASEMGIYIQLTLLHHGMFSETVNPMWEGSSNTWYTSQYGANPYASIIDSPGEFFTDEVAKATFKNYLQYIIARYGYSENLLSYEVFNEVDWVESYTSKVGTAWHNEMATFIKENDAYNHMVTTSVKGDNFSSDIYSVFALDNIDYVNVHNYGTYNYLNYVPGKTQEGFRKFNKPIFYTEVGYSGMSGTEQNEKDPLNITLHQELWAGIMSSVGAGMNWWWESWVEPFNAYYGFNGAAKFAHMLDLEGTSFKLIGTSNDVVNNNSTKIKNLGYIVDNRVYAYLYQTGYNVGNPTPQAINNVTLSINNFTNGNYQVVIYDTNTLEIKSSTVVSVLNNVLVVKIGSVINDIALIATPL